MKQGFTNHCLSQVCSDIPKNDCVFAASFVTFFGNFFMAAYNLFTVFVLLTIYLF